MSEPFAARDTAPHGYVRKIALPWDSLSHSLRSPVPLKEGGAIFECRAGVADFAPFKTRTAQRVWNSDSDVQSTGSRVR